MRMVVLANGDQVPIGDASVCYGLLCSHLECPDTEWDAVFYLRMLCLGDAIEREQLTILRQEGLVEADGSVGETMKSIVLSSVRGEGRLLHLDSPFVDPEDRKIAIFLDTIHSLDDEFLDSVLAQWRIDRRKVREFSDVNKTLPTELPSVRELVDQHWPLSESMPDDAPKPPERYEAGKRSEPATDELLKRLKLRGRGLFTDEGKDEVPPR